MATVLRTTLPALLLNIQAWLVSRGLAGDASCVKLWAGRDLPTPTNADKVIYLWPKGQETNRPFAEGAGRIDTRVRRRVLVLLFTRLDVDAADQADAFLTDPSLGHLVTEHALFDALQCYLPTDQNGNALVAHPLKLEAADEVDRFNPPTGWGLSASQFDLAFVLDLDQSRQ